MPTTSTSSQGAAIKVKISGTFTAVGQAVGFSGPSPVQDFEDVTNLDSTGGYKEWQPTLRDGGTVTFDLILDGANTGQTHLRDSNASGTKDDFQAVFPFATPITAAFSGYCTKFEWKAEMGKALRASVEIKVTGAITYS